MNLIEPTTITFEYFYKEFPPNKNCKDCYGRGRITRIMKGVKSKSLCHCMVNKYKKSGKNYHIIMEKE